MSFERFKTWAISYLQQSRAGDWQEVDISAEFDSSLTFAENKDIFKAKYPISNLEVLARLEASSLKQDLAEQDANSRYIEAVREQVNTRLEQLRNQPIKAGSESVDNRFSNTIKTLVRNVAKGYNNALFIVSDEAGIGKSSSVLECIMEPENNIKQDEFAYISGYSTPLSLYELLFQHKDKKLIILDDLEVAFKDQKVIALLKAAIWSVTGIRKLEYHSSSKALKAPTEFIFNARLVVVANQLPQSTQVKAMLSRSLFYEIKITHAEKMEMLMQFIKLPYKQLTEGQRFEVFDYIKSSSPELFDELSYRTIIKLYELAAENSSSWKTVADEIMQKDLQLDAYAQSMNEPTTRDQISKFEELTGLGRRSFFRAKKKYFEKMRM